MSPREDQEAVSDRGRVRLKLNLLLSWVRRSPALRIKRSVFRTVLFMYFHCAIVFTDVQTRLHGLKFVGVTETTTKNKYGLKITQVRVCWACTVPNAAEPQARSEHITGFSATE